MSTQNPTIEQAADALEAQEQLPPTQRDQQVILGALAILDSTGHADVLGWTGRVAFMLEEMTGQEVTIDELRSLMRSQESIEAGSAPQDVTVGGGEVQPLPDVPASAAGAGGLAGGVGPPPVPPPENDEPPVAQRPFIGGFPARFGQSTVSHPAQRVETVGGPRYRAGDEWTSASKSPTEIRRQQKKLEKAGLLEPGSYTPGFWDQATAKAMGEAMGYANAQSADVDDIVSELASLRPSRRDDVKQFIPPQEVKPDPAEISQRVKGWFRDRLGREPTDAEMGEFAGYLSGQYGAAYETQVAQARSQFELQNPPDPGMTRTEDSIGAASIPRPARPEPPGQQTFTAVNPEARFRERFESRFGPEIDRLAALPEVRENMNNVFASLRTMSSLVG